MRGTGTRIIGVLLAAAVAGCAGGGEGSGAPGDADATGVDDATAASGGDRGVVEVVDDVGYYGACGNETLELDDGRRFYPLLPEEIEQLGVENSYGEEATGELVIAAPVSVVLAVSEPGPGDDVGSLTIFDDGFARFDSESGWELWLTEDERTYEWEC